MEGSKHGQIEVLSSHLLGETDENQDSLPTLIADGTTAEIQTRHPNACLEHHHFINPFGTFSLCITDDLLSYHNIYFSLNIVFQWLAFCFIYFGGGSSLHIWL
jgi:hypothetical protein